MKSLKLLSAALLVGTALMGTTNVFAAAAAAAAGGAGGAAGGANLAALDADFAAPRATIGGLKRSPSLDRIYGSASTVAEADREAALATSIQTHTAAATAARGALPAAKTAPAAFAFDETAAKAALTDAFGADASNVVLFKNTDGSYVAGKLNGTTVEKAESGALKIGKRPYLPTSGVETGATEVTVTEGNEAIAAALAAAKAKHEKATADVATYNTTRSGLETELNGIDAALATHVGQHATYKTQYGVTAATDKLNAALTAAGVAKKADLTGKDPRVIALFGSTDATVLQAAVGILKDLIGVDATALQDLRDELAGEKADGKANIREVARLTAALAAAKAAPAAAAAPAAPGVPPVTGGLVGGGDSHGDASPRRSSAPDAGAAAAAARAAEAAAALATHAAPKLKAGYFIDEDGKHRDSNGDYVTEFEAFGS
jgi:hypothetical protein